jgi:aspartyl protease family protein
VLKPLSFMIVAGVVIGLAWPSDDPAKQAAAAVADNGMPRETILEREGNGHFYVHAKVNGVLVRFMVDTGASGVALTEEDAERVGIPFSPGEFEYVGEGASGPVRGKLITLDEVEIDGKKVENVSGAILQGSNLSLLGQAYLSRMGELYINGDRMILR